MMLVVASGSRVGSRSRVACRARARARGREARARGGGRPSVFAFGYTISMNGGGGGAAVERQCGKRERTVPSSRANGTRGARREGMVTAEDARAARQ